jgi:hypothetical protein
LVDLVCKKLKKSLDYEIVPSAQNFIYVYIYTLLHVNMCFIALEKKPIASDGIDQHVEQTPKM